VVRRVGEEGGLVDADSELDVAKSKSFWNAKDFGGLTAQPYGSMSRAWTSLIWAHEPSQDHYCKYS
jgi:hypothetical protein